MNIDFKSKVIISKMNSIGHTINDLCICSNGGSKVNLYFYKIKLVDVLIYGYFVKGANCDIEEVINSFVDSIDSTRSSYEKVKQHSHANNTFIISQIEFKIHLIERRYFDLVFEDTHEFARKLSRDCIHVDDFLKILDSLDIKQFSPKLDIEESY